MSASVLNDKQFAAVAVAIAAGLAYLYYKRGAIGEAVNPVSRNNLAHKGVNAVGEAVTGDSNWTLGGAMFELLNPQAVAREREITGTVYR